MVKEKPILVNLYVVDFSYRKLQAFWIYILYLVTFFFILYLLCLVCIMFKVYCNPNANKNQISIRLVLLCVVINQLTRVT